MSVEQVVLKLFKIGAVKFGEFTLKSGIQSPFYIDLRLIVSYPDLLRQISELVYNKIKNLKYDVLCGVPYTALPIATYISAVHDIPMVMRRKEVKNYGTKKAIEGVFKKNDICLIVEDLITSGTSILETCDTLTNVGMKVTDSVVLIDRQQGGVNNLRQSNINLHSITDIKTILQILKKKSLVSNDMIDKVNLFLKANQSVKVKKTIGNNNSNNNNNNNNSKRLSFEERLKIINNPISQKLLQIILSKKSLLCAAADLTSAQEILNLVEKIGPYICLLKTHIDIIVDYNNDFITKLQKLSEKYNFLIFEDRKFADIGNTVVNQFQNGIYKISSWANIINAHIIPGDGIIDGLKKVSFKNNKCNHGLLLLAQMSSKGNLINQQYTDKNVQYANEHSDFVMGFICQEKISSDKFLYMTPGVNLSVTGDNLKQQYNTPQHVIGNKGSDIIIVGRGIYKSKDPVKSAQQYNKQAWDAYLQALQNNPISKI